MRGLAILWVVLHHTYAFTSVQTLTGAAYVLIWTGVLGVDIFFVTSGFLITGLLLDDVRQGRIRISRFYIRRAFKIVPSYVVVLVVAFLMSLASNARGEAAGFLPYVFMVQNYVHGTDSLAHLWSIAVEEHFYLIYPVLLWCVCRTEHSPQRRCGLAVAVLVLLMLMFNVVRIVWLPGHAAEDVVAGRIHQMSHVRFDALFFGCLLRFILSDTGNESQRGILLPGLYCVLGGLFLGLAMIHYSELEWWMYTLAYAGAGCLLMSGWHGFPPMKAILEIPVLRWVGRNSYGIYLWHYLLLGSFLEIWQRLGQNNLVIIAYFVAALAMGSMMTHVVERRFLVIRNQLVP